MKNNYEALFNFISLANIWEAKEKFGCPKQREAHKSGNRRRRCTEVRWTWPHILAVQGGPLTDTHGRDPGHTFHSAINMQACLQYWKQEGAASRHSLNVQQAKLNKQMNWTGARSFMEEKKREGERRWLAGRPSERRRPGGWEAARWPSRCSGDTQRAVRRKVYRRASAERQGLKDVWKERSQNTALPSWTLPFCGELLPDRASERKEETVHSTRAVSRRWGRDECNTLSSRVTASLNSLNPQNFPLWPEWPADSQLSAVKCYQRLDFFSMNIFIDIYSQMWRGARIFQYKIHSEERSSGD